MVAQDRVAALLRSAGAPLGQPGQGWAGVQRRRQQRARRRVLGATGVAVVLAGTGIVVVPLTRGASSPPPAVISAGDPSPSQPGPTDGVQPAPSHQAGTTDVPLPGVQNIDAVALTADAVTLVLPTHSAAVSSRCATCASPSASGSARSRPIPTAGRCRARLRRAGGWRG